MHAEQITDPHARRGQFLEATLDGVFDESPGLHRADALTVECVPKQDADHDLKSLLAAVIPREHQLIGARPTTFDRSRDTPSANSTLITGALAASFPGVTPIQGTE